MKRRFQNLTKGWGRRRMKILLIQIRIRIAGASGATLVWTHSGNLCQRKFTHLFWLKFLNPMQESQGLFVLKILSESFQNVDDLFLYQFLILSLFLGIACLLLYLACSPWHILSSKPGKNKMTNYLENAEKVFQDIKYLFRSSFFWRHNCLSGARNIIAFLVFL